MVSVKNENLESSPSRTSTTTDRLIRPKQGVGIKIFNLASCFIESGASDAERVAAASVR